MLVTVERSAVLACLIVMDDSIATEELYESRYDFNPEAHEVVTKIEELLNCSGQKSRETRNRELAALCEESFTKASAEKFERTGWLQKTIWIHVSKIINCRLESKKVNPRQCRGIRSRRAEESGSGSRQNDIQAHSFNSKG